MPLGPGHHKNYCSVLHKVISMYKKLLRGVFSHSDRDKWCFWSIKGMYMHVVDAAISDPANFWGKNSNKIKIWLLYLLRLTFAAVSALTRGWWGSCSLNSRFFKVSFPIDWYVVSGMDWKISSHYSYSYHVSQSLKSWKENISAQI